MREIKFRVWCEGECLSLSEAIFNEIVVIQHNREDCFAIERVYEDVEIEQYTGIKDKNGVEIFVGDIVSQHTEWSETTYFDGAYSDSESCETETVGVVKIYPSKGVVITRCKRVDIISCDGDWEKAWDCNVRSCRSAVIGNIHQNPELLK